MGLSCIACRCRKTVRLEHRKYRAIFPSGQLQAFKWAIASRSTALKGIQWVFFAMSALHKTGKCAKLPRQTLELARRKAPMRRPPHLPGEAQMHDWKKDFIEALKVEIEQFSRLLERLETGKFTLGEKSGSGPWVDTTQREIERLRGIISSHNALIAKVEAETLSRVG
jgi:hypothetical protein